ncbi:NTP transferase domain-containing protein [Novosphingobium sp. 2637]|uniref:NTP transferase domain-containing protein n=1 Tax=Novosphingobium mangrovi (ex Hu et al. 2023) TaxID=2930094 RepID=A0ABT0ACQ4_9SPHN|nr:NTP transferase domain-containing protein [Novosphingobium mangrovi (ex Hu et al. 2023)]
MSATFEGEPLVHHAIRTACAAPVDRVLVAARPDLDLSQWQAPEGAPPVTILRVESAALSTTIKAGVAALGDVDALFVFLGDMPRVPSEEAAHLARILADNFAAFPRHGGKPGHPVLLSARALAHVPTLTGDAGAGQILRGRTDVVFHETQDFAVRLDIDRPEDLARLKHEAED